MKDLAILSLELILFIMTSLQKSRQSICSCIYFALAVVNSKIVLGKLLGLADLSRSQTLYIYEPTKAVVIYKDKHLVLATFQIVMPCLENFDNSYMLAVMGLISSLCRNHFFQKKRHKILLA